MRAFCRRRSSTGLGAFVLVVVTVSSVRAQAPSPGASGRQVYQEQLRVRLDEQVPEAREVGVDGGGWFTFALFHYDDATGPIERTLRQYQLRGWASVNVKGIHQAYIRGLLNFDDWGVGENPAPGRDDDFDEELERVWYQVDIGRLLGQEVGAPSPVDVRFKVGREFTTIGTALVLSQPLDEIRLDVAAWDWQLAVFLGKTDHDSENLDRSLAVAGQQKRTFFGAELAFLGFDPHRLFVFYLSNHDHTSPDPFDPFQSYEYESRYVGIGSEGTLCVPELHYHAEFVGEGGRTYSEGVAHGKDRIRAWALDVLFEYLCPVAMHPQAMAEYLFATGDSDRRFSSTSTVGGNRANTRDKAFNAFGFRDTGIALAPELTNVHIFVGGASLFPLEWIEAFRKMEIGSKVFFYMKAREDGATSDITATNDARWLGWEWDFFCDWRLTSDLALTVRYGIFMPGAAYDGSEDGTRSFLYSGVSLSF